MNIRVEVQYACQFPHLPDKKMFTRWVKAIAQNIPRSQKMMELTIRIVDASEGRELNEQWRHRSYATNVLSFPFESPAGLLFPLLGDIVICAPVVEQEAKEQNKSLWAHWAHLVIHGTLHLLGHDHLEETQAQVMESLEIAALQSLGYPNPYLEIQ